MSGQNKYVILKGGNKPIISDVIADCQLGLCIDTKVGESLTSILRKMCARISTSDRGYVIDGQNTSITGIGTKSDPYKVNIASSTGLKSVGLQVPVGLIVENSPLTSDGEFKITLPLEGILKGEDGKFGVVGIGTGLDYTGGALSIVGYNSTNWDEAYSWGNHGSAGYLTSFTETDPTVASHIKLIPVGTINTNYLGWNGTGWESRNINWSEISNVPSLESPLTFENGLTRTGDTITLGGTILADTTIDAGGFNFFVSNAYWAWLSAGTSGTDGSIVTVNHNEASLESYDSTSTDVAYLRLYHSNKAIILKTNGTSASTIEAFDTSIVLSAANNATVFTLNSTGATLSNIPAATIDTDKFLVSDGGILKYRTGSQLLSDIGAAPSSGSSSYVQVQDAAAQVGASFWIGGRGYANTGLISYRVVQAGYTGYEVTPSGEGGMRMTMGGTLTYGWLQSNGGPMVLNYNEAVGTGVIIGAATSFVGTERLRVVGDVNISGAGVVGTTLTVGGKFMQGSIGATAATNAYNYIQGGLTVGRSGSNQILGLGSDASGNVIQAYEYSVGYKVLDIKASTLNIQIGSVTPTTVGTWSSTGLSVTGNITASGKAGIGGAVHATANLNVVGGSFFNGGIDIGQYYGDANVQLSISSASKTYLLGLYDNGTPRVRFYRNGAVSIGTVSQTYKLNVENTTGALGVDIKIVGGSTGNPAINIQNGTVNSIITPTGSTMAIGNYTNHIIQFFQNNAPVAAISTTYMTTQGIFSAGYTNGYAVPTTNGGYGITLGATSAIGYAWIKTTTGILSIDSTNLIIGGSTDNGAKLQVVGNATISGTLGVTGATTLTNLAGTGDRMVVANASGLLSTQAIPTGSSYTFTNGLTNTAGVVTLEGALTKNTDITIDGYYFFIGDTTADTYFTVDEGFQGGLATVMSGGDTGAYSWYEAGGSYFAAGSYGVTSSNQARFELIPSQFTLESKTSTNVGFRILGTATTFAIKAQTGIGTYVGGIDIDSSGNVTMPANANIGDAYTDVHTTKGIVHREANSYARVTHVTLAATTTDGATPAPLTRDGNAISGTTNRIVIATGKSYAVEAHIVGRTSAGVTRYYKIAYLVSNTGGTTSIIGTHTSSSMGDSTTWSITVGVDDTNDCLGLEVNGEASTTVKWSANIVMTEVSA